MTKGLSVKYELPPRLLVFMKEIGAGTEELNRGAREGFWKAIRDYVSDVVAPSHHATAERLGATPTGHIEEAGRTMTSSADRKGVEVQVHSPGFPRVYGDITVTPKRRRFLTIPVHQDAYGEDASTIGETYDTFIGKGKGGGLFIGRALGAEESFYPRRLVLPKLPSKSESPKKPKKRREPKKHDETDKVEILYLLRTKSKIKQDRSLLPSNEELTEYARKAYGESLELMLSKRGLA